MFAKKYLCKVVASDWLTPTVVRIRFTPFKRFNFEPGQFVSVVVPPSAKHTDEIKRCYSLASSPDEAKAKGFYELCVKVAPQGRGSTYIASLKPLDTFTVFASYGALKYTPPAPGRRVCFISTGTGIAPFRSIILSSQYLENRPEKALLLQGIRTESEILYPGELEKAGVEVVNAISRPNSDWPGFSGRVSDFLRNLSSTWSWHSTDFYLCGSGEMVHEVSQILQGGYGINPNHIHAEAFSSVKKIQSQPKQIPSLVSEPKIAAEFIPSLFMKKSA